MSGAHTSRRDAPGEARRRYGSTSEDRVRQAAQEAEAARREAEAEEAHWNPPRRHFPEWKQDQARGRYEAHRRAELREERERPRGLI